MYSNNNVLTEEVRKKLKPYFHGGGRTTIDATIRNIGHVRNLYFSGKDFKDWTLDISKVGKIESWELSEDQAQSLRSYIVGVISFVEEIKRKVSNNVSESVSEVIVQHIDNNLKEMTVWVELKIPGEYDARIVNLAAEMMKTNGYVVRSHGSYSNRGAYMFVCKTHDNWKEKSRWQNFKNIFKTI